MKKTDKELVKTIAESEFGFKKSLVVPESAESTKFGGLSKADFNVCDIWYRVEVEKDEVFLSILDESDVIFDETGIETVAEEEETEQAEEPAEKKK